jgi:ABC-type transport system substrate-binding protein
MVISPKAIDAAYKDTTDAPVGTRPYKLVKSVPESKVVLERNDACRGDKGRYTTTEFTIFAIFANTVSMVQAFQAGQLDFMTRVPFSDQKLLERDGRYDVQVMPTLWLGEMRASSKDPKSPPHNERGPARDRPGLGSRRDRQAGD